MSRFISVLILSVMIPASLAAEHPKAVAIGALESGAQFISIKSRNGWGLAVTGAGSASAAQPTPARFEFYVSAGDIQQKNAGYATLNNPRAKHRGCACLWPRRIPLHRRGPLDRSRERALGRDLALFVERTHAARPKTIACCTGKRGVPT